MSGNKRNPELLKMGKTRVGAPGLEGTPFGLVCKGNQRNANNFRVLTLKQAWVDH